MSNIEKNKLKLIHKKHTKIYEKAYNKLGWQLARPKDIQMNAFRVIGQFRRSNCAAPTSAQTQPINQSLSNKKDCYDSIIQSKPIYAKGPGFGVDNLYFGAGIRTGIAIATSKSQVSYLKFFTLIKSAFFFKQISFGSKKHLKNDSRTLPSHILQIHNQQKLVPSYQYKLLKNPKKLNKRSIPFKSIAQQSIRYQLIVPVDLTFHRSLFKYSNSSKSLFTQQKDGRNLVCEGLEKNFPLLFSRSIIFFQQEKPEIMKLIH